MRDNAGAKKEAHVAMHLLVASPKRSGVEP
jgi:hypothetical protein